MDFRPHFANRVVNIADKISLFRKFITACRCSDLTAIAVDPDQKNQLRKEKKFDSRKIGSTWILASSARNQRIFYAKLAGSAILF